MKRIILSENQINILINEIAGQSSTKGFGGESFIGDFMNNNNSNESENATNNNTYNKSVSINLNQPKANGWALSDKGIQFIKSWEGFRGKPYIATKYEKKYTIGYGHVMNNNEYNSWVKNGQKQMSEQEASKLLLNDIQKYISDLVRIVGTLPKNYQNASLYPQGFVDACISIVYNAGIGNFSKSNFFRTWKNMANNGTLKIINNNNVLSLDKNSFISLAQLIKTTCATNNGNPSNGLQNRRNKEFAMAISGNYSRA